MSSSRRTSSRLGAVKALYAGAISEQINDKKQASELALDIISLYHKNDLAKEDSNIDENFLSSIIKGVCENKQTFDQSITKYLSDSWRLERLSPVIQSILQSAVFELMQYSDTPKKVIINEYVNITHRFFDEKEVSFVNGILDKIAQEIRGDE